MVSVFPYLVLVDVSHESYVIPAGYDYLDAIQVYRCLAGILWWLGAVPYRVSLVSGECVLLFDSRGSGGF